MILRSFQKDIDAVGRIAAVPTILDVVCRTTGMGFAAVARVTEDRWIACSVKDDIAFGLKPGGELKVETTICHEIRQSGESVIINNVSEDEHFCRHHTPALYGFQSYISMPIVLPDGTFFGTLCAIDPKPAKLNTPEIIGMFKLFAELIAFHLDALNRLDASETDLGQERQTAELREQFIAVLGHDLRSPLTAIASGSRLLKREALSVQGQQIVQTMLGATSRMASLIENLLDFAKGRLGGGLAIVTKSEPIEPILAQVVDELRAGHPDRVIDVQFDLLKPLALDGQRIGQLASNLIANALAYGDADKAIQVNGITNDNGFELSVTNSGAPITPESLEKLFLPFVRGANNSGKKGLGLGLYIASEIARAHGGDLTAASANGETRFTFRIPLGVPIDAGEKLTAQ